MRAESGKNSESGLLFLVWSVIILLYRSRRREKPNMTAISIRRDSASADVPRFRAVAGEHEAVGPTMGAALDALTANWGEEAQPTAVFIQHFGPDAFFTAAQHDRMEELRVRRDTLSSQERAELESLIDAEFEATVARAEKMLRSAQP